jgi:HK97 family phage major capsid protein
MSNEHTLNAITELNQAFEAFKSANDDRLNALEQKKTDPIAVDKVERLNTLMDQISVKLNQTNKATQRPFLGQSSSSDDLELKAFNQYLLTGNKAGLPSLEKKYLDGSTPEKGGVLIPNVISEDIGDEVKNLCPLMTLANVVILNTGTRHRFPRVKADGGGDFKFNAYLADANKHWGSVSKPSDDKEELQIEMVEIPLHTINYNHKIAWDLLENLNLNLNFNLTSFLKKGMSEHVGSTCNRAFFYGDGDKKPKGLLTDLVDNNTEKYKIEAIKTDQNGGLKENEEYKILLDLMGSLKSRYNTGASWLISREAMKLFRSIKAPDEQRYLWTPNHMVDGTSSFLGYPVTQCDEFKPLSDNDVAVIFGNFKQGYTIVHREVITLIRDDMTPKPDVEFLMRYGYGGSVTNGEALKALKFCTK